MFYTKIFKVFTSHIKDEFKNINIDYKILNRNKTELKKLDLLMYKMLLNNYMYIKYT